LLGLLAAETVVLDRSFDASPLLHESNGWLARFLAHAGVVRLATAATSAIVLLGGSRIWADLKTAFDRAKSGRQVWPWLVAHLFFFVAFYRLTAGLFDAQPSAQPLAIGVALWLVVGSVALASLAASILPLPALWALATETLPIAAGCAGVGVAALAAGLAAESLWVPLGQSTLWLVVQLLAPFTSDLVLAPEGFIVGTSAFRIGITPECSGYQGIGLICVFLAVYLRVFRDTLRFPRALFLIPVGIVAMWIANGVRIATLVAIGSYVSPEVAIGGFHSNSGFLFLCVVALAIGWAGQRSSLFAKRDARAVEESPGRPTVAYLSPLVAGVGTAMITGALTAGGFDALYGLRVLTVATALWWFRRDLAALRPEWSWLGAAAGLAAFVVWLPLELVALGEREASIGVTLSSMSRPAALVWLALRTVGAVVTVPIAEELAFRGYLMRRLVSRDFESVAPTSLPWPSLLVSSVLFGALHASIVAGTLVGLIYGLVYSRSGSLASAVVAHAVTNMLLAGYVLATGSWGLW
jgi:exosortase E/protease (VPEID-CTERM system)